MVRKTGNTGQARRKARTKEKPKVNKQKDSKISKSEFNFQFDDENLQQRYITAWKKYEKVLPNFPKPKSVGRIDAISLTRGKNKKSLDDNQGTSHVMIHSQKGERIIKELAETLTLYEVDLNEAVESEPAMVECAKPSKLRHDFFTSIASGQDVFDIYFKENIKIKIERFLRKILSKTGLYSLIKRMIKG